MMKDEIGGVFMRFQALHDHAFWSFAGLVKIKG